MIEENNGPPRLTLADLRGLTPDDLRDLSELRREHDALAREHGALKQEAARLEDENRYLRAQFTEAVAGWRDEQRRAREANPAEAAGQYVAEETPPTPTGPWARLWACLTD